MNGLPWRDLRSVMVATVHVAVVAYLIRSFTRRDAPATSVYVWVPVSIVVALGLTWPLGRAFAAAFDPDQSPRNRRCSRCGSQELRPLLRSGAGIFQPVTSYRCVRCMTTFRQVGSAQVEEPAISWQEPPDPSGVRFLDEPPTEAEIRFLDEP